MSSTSSSRVATYRYREAGPVPMAAATERIVTAPRPLASASVTPADAISARLCSGDGPLAERSGLVQMLGPLAAPPRTGFIANTVLSNVACTQIANVDRSFSTAERYAWAMWQGDVAGRCAWAKGEWR